MLPASQVNQLIAGASRSGKSYLTGLLAEQLIDLGYSVVVVDPEGDHTALGQLPGAVVVGGTEPLPDVDRIGHVVTGDQRAIVIDLTQLADHERGTYFRAAMARLEGLRAHTGVPHWLVVDEAHEQLGCDGKLGVYAPSRKGHYLVTYRPGDLRREVTDNLDALVVMPKGAADAGDPAPRRSPTMRRGATSPAGSTTSSRTPSSPTSSGPSRALSTRTATPRPAAARCSPPSRRATSSSTTDAPRAVSVSRRSDPERAGVRHVRTTSTGHGAWRMTVWLTDPSSMRATPCSPRLPTTRSRASCAAWRSARAGWSWTRVRLMTRSG